MLAAEIGDSGVDVALSELAVANVGLDLMWTGLIGGTAGYAAYRLREVLR